MARLACRTAYWGIAQRSRGPEEADVLPERSVSRDDRSRYAFTALESAPSRGVGLVEAGDGVGPLLCLDDRRAFFGHLAGAQAQQRTPAVAGILLRGSGQTGDETSGHGGGELLCSLVRLGVEVVGRVSSAYG